MPELPDITVYIEALESRIVGETLERTRIPKPFLLRSVDPPISAAQESEYSECGEWESESSSGWRTIYFSSFT